VTIFIHNKLPNSQHSTTTKCARQEVENAQQTAFDIDQLHYLNAECPFWVLISISMLETVHGPPYSFTPLTACSTTGI